MSAPRRGRRDGARGTRESSRISGGRPLPRRRRPGSGSDRRRTPTDGRRAFPDRVRAGRNRNDPAAATAMPESAKHRRCRAQSRKPRHRRDDLRVTMINLGSTCDNGARPSRFDRRLPEPRRRRPCGGRRLPRGSGAWIVHKMCMRCACRPGPRRRRLSERNPRLAPPRQPRLTPPSSSRSRSWPAARRRSGPGCARPRCRPSPGRSGRRSRSRPGPRPSAGRARWRAARAGPR